MFSGLDLINIEFPLEYKFDLVVNVTGPSSILHCAKEIPIYKSFIKSANPEGTNLKTKKNFELVNLSNIFTPGTLANGFNNSRKTIIEAIINNSTLSSKSIFNKIKNFKSNYLLKIQKTFIDKEKNFSVTKTLIRLKKLLDKLDARLNIYLAVILNGLFLWDIHTTAQIENWKRKNNS